MAPLIRQKRVNFQASEAEQEMLRALADHDGVSMSDCVRQLIRRRHAEVFGAQPAKPKPKGKAKR